MIEKDINDNLLKYSKNHDNSLKNEGFILDLYAN